MNRCRRIVDQFFYRLCVDRRLVLMVQPQPQPQPQPPPQVMNETLLELLRSDDFDVFAQGVEIGRTMGYSDTKLLSYTSPLIVAPLFNQWSNENDITEDHLGNPYWIRSLVIFEKLDKRYRKENDLYWEKADPRFSKYYRSKHLQWLLTRSDPEYIQNPWEYGLAREAVHRSFLQTGKKNGDAVFKMLLNRLGEGQP